MLKEILLTASLGLSTLGLFAQKEVTVLEVNGEKVTLEQFNSVYNKNSETSANVDPITKKEYMDLYLNFKLKVAEAEALGLDTLSKFNAELDKYVGQLQKPYLIDQTFNEELVSEAYERLQFDVSASHILIRLGEMPTPADTLKAYQKIMEAYDLIKSGEDFEKVAKAYSEDPSVKQNGGYLGYFSAFKMVYPFENAAFNTEVGEVSLPFKTSFGYHIMKVDDKRAAMGEVQVAHIMIKETPEMTEQERERAKDKIFEIYNKLESGTDFSRAARNFSQDRGSAEKGGVLPWFGSGRMVPEFENVAYGLEKNTYSKPFETSYGWHIVMKIDQRGMGDFESEKEEIRKKVERDGRAAGSRASLIGKLKVEYKVKESKKNIEPFYLLNGSEKTDSDWTAEKAKDMQAVVLKINDKKYGKQKIEYTQYDFAKYLEKYLKMQSDLSHVERVDEAFEIFVDNKIIAYEKTVLYEKYPEYRALYDEYHDGILLFDLMNQEVWNKAQTDTAGLEAFYEANKDEFMWGKRIDASIYSCTSQQVADSVKAMLTAGTTDSAIVATQNQQSKLAVVIKSGVYSEGQQEVLNEVPWIQGVSDIYPSAGRFIVVNVREVLPAMPKTLLEAKGLVIAKYQEYLEKNWIESLRSKYTYQVYWENIEE